MELVTTTRLMVPASAQAWSTLIVPSTAVRTITASLVAPAGKGEATWNTYVQRCTAFFQLSGLERSASTRRKGYLGSDTSSSNG